MYENPRCSCTARARSHGPLPTRALTCEFASLQDSPPLGMNEVIGARCNRGLEVCLAFADGIRISQQSEQLQFAKKPVKWQKSDTTRTLKIIGSEYSFPNPNKFACLALRKTYSAPVQLPNHEDE